MHNDITNHHSGQCDYEEWYPDMNLNDLDQQIKLANQSPEDIEVDDRGAVLSPHEEYEEWEYEKKCLDKQACHEPHCKTSSNAWVQHPREL